MKTLVQRIIPLLLAIVLGSVLSWVSIYAFWFGVWTFHNVPAARACDAIGTFLLLPARMIFREFGGDQTSLFFDPNSYSVTNGLVLGVAGYLVFQRIVRNRGSELEQRKAETRERASTRI